MTLEQQTLAWLDENNIPYTILQHAAAYTMEDMAALGITNKGLVAKNLFLRDQKGKKHYLVCVAGDKRVDLKAMGEGIGEKLSFASEERLQKYLKLSKGAVTPLGALFDETHSVVFLLDKDLANAPTLGVHPCANTATVFISYQDLKNLLLTQGCQVQEIIL